MITEKELFKKIRRILKRPSIWELTNYPTIKPKIIPGYYTKSWGLSFLEVYEHPEMVDELNLFLFFFNGKFIIEKVQVEHQKFNLFTVIVPENMIKNPESLPYTEPMTLDELGQKFKQMLSSCYENLWLVDSKKYINPYGSGNNHIYFTFGQDKNLNNYPQVMDSIEDYIESLGGGRLYCSSTTNEHPYSYEISIHINNINVVRDLTPLETAIKKIKSFTKEEQEELKKYIDF